MLSSLSSSLWGIMLFPLLGAGLFLTLKIKTYRISPSKLLRSTVLYRCDRGSSPLSQRQAVCTTLAATMGTGNIVGVATALTLGGAGAVFWMWVSAFLGASLTYAENFLSVKYREKYPDCSSCGAMLYIEKGVGSKPLALIFSALCVLSSLGIGNMTQSNSIAASLPLPPVVTGGITALLVGAVILGGAKRIGSLAEKLIPILSALYILSALLLIVCNFRALPTVFSDIFSDAFGLREAVGGFSGYALKQALTVGLRRGIFSNEAGLGSAGILHSFAPGSSPERQGLWGIFEVFLDTGVCCTLTALAVLSGIPNCKGLSLDGVSLVSEAFSSLYGRFSPVFVGGSVILFAFATLVGWEAIGEKAWSFVTHGASTLIYRYIYVFFVLLGATLSLESVWFAADIFNALMLAPNVFALVALSSELKP